MEYVLKEKQGVLVSDAASDALQHRGQHSALRYPRSHLRAHEGPHETLGVIYLDTRTSAREVLAKNVANATGKFTEDHLKLAIAIGHQAAHRRRGNALSLRDGASRALAAIGQTIAALSHHIKNILQGLKSGSEILKMGLGDKDEVLLQKGWKIVEKNQGKIYDLVMDMLSYSKEREPAIEETDLNAVVEDVIDLLENRTRN